MVHFVRILDLRQKTKNMLILKKVYIYIYSSVRVYFAAYLDAMDQDTGVLDTFPENILYKHSVQAWISSYELWKQINDGRRKQ